MNDKNLKIIKHYGFKNQQKKLQEEVFELQEAISLQKYGEDTIEHITEEIADVFVLLDQFVAYYDINPEEIKKIFEYKINRQIGRIKNN